uniref:Hairy/enhancer-of-split related with YRPW motif protein n=1 Tax=Strigamia maritima TaxID=126957 RepID=T1JGK4_STRMM
MKRNLSDSEVDDVFDDNSKGPSSQGSDSCQMQTRKKRRGLIEKRRRDRINSSLTELRRLVPAAFEKQHTNAEYPLDVRSLLSPQGSAKLEKAEILQMTVDHLKMLHTKGLDPLTCDPHKFAMDYHGLGFQECATEVSRYLISMEGMDVQDPLRLRLMSHLQCFSAQRDLANKPPHSSWVPYNSSSQYSNPFPHINMNEQQTVPLSSSIICSDLRGQHPIQSNDDVMGMSSNQMRMPTSGGGNVGMSGIGSQMPGSQYPVSLNISTHCFSTSAQTNYSPTVTTTQPGPSVKPYRPWGAGLAY